MSESQMKKETWMSSWKETELSIVTKRIDRICEILKSTSIHCTEDERAAYMQEINELEEQRKKIIFQDTKKNKK